MVSGRTAGGTTGGAGRRGCASRSSVAVHSTRTAGGTTGRAGHGCYAGSSLPVVNMGVGCFGLQNTAPLAFTAVISVSQGSISDFTAIAAVLRYSAACSNPFVNVDSLFRDIWKNRLGIGWGVGLGVGWGIGLGTVLVFVGGVCGTAEIAEAPVKGVSCKETSGITAEHAGHGCYTGGSLPIMDMSVGFDLWLCGTAE